MTFEQLATAGFGRFGIPKGSLVPSLDGLCPVPREHWEEVMAGPAQSWDYAVKVLRTLRDPLSSQSKGQREEMRRKAEREAFINAGR